MKVDKFGQIIFAQQDVCDLLMQGVAYATIHNMLVDSSIDLEKISTLVSNSQALIAYNESTQSVTDFDRQQQQNWFMPEEYQQLDIAEHVLDLCKTQEQLQRVGEELLLYQEKNLLDLLRYLKYLVDTMKQNSVIWGVGRGSSVASYVLFLLGVHRIDSMYYDLDISEFLR
jgi:DNA polymerase III alpha subunit